MSHDSTPPARPEYLQASRVSVARSMTLYAIGALVGLAIAGYGLFTAQGTSTRNVPPENLAMVNQRPILRSDFVTQLESETGKTFEETTHEERLKVLDEMVREELLVQRALELDFAETDQDSRNALVSSVTQQILAEVTTSQPTDDQLKEYYEQHKTQYSTAGVMTVHNLLLPKAAGASTDAAMAKANDAVKALRSGAPVEQAIVRFGLVENKKYEEEFYFAAKIHLGDDLFAAASKLADGAVSDPLSLNDGLHILKMIRNAAPTPLDFSSSRAQVLTDYKDAAQMRLIEATVKFLRGRSKILIAPDYANDYKP